MARRDLPSSVRPSARSLAVDAKTPFPSAPALSLNVVTTVAIAALSLVLATDLYLWELVLRYLGSGVSGLLTR